MKNIVAFTGWNGEEIEINGQINGPEQLNEIEIVVNGTQVQLAVDSGVVEEITKALLYLYFEDERSNEAIEKIN